MKTFRLCCVFILFFITGAFLPYAIQEEKEQTKFFELENGLKVFLYKKQTIPLVNLVLAVNVGSKDETEESNGLVHLLEHCILFRGTEFRTGEEIGRDIRKHGAYFNAHTGLDISFFELSLPSENLDFALKNQKEIVFNLKITQDELDQEKQVILEELSQIHNDPVKYSTSLAYQNLFAGHPYQKPVYGKADVIKAVTADQMKNFYQSYFQPSNCVLAVVGRFDLKELEEKIKSEFGILQNHVPPLKKFEKTLPLKKTIEIKEEMDVNVAYLVIGIPAPDYNSPQQYAADLLTEILGRGINPMLNIPLRGRRILANSISMEYSSLKYGGAFLIHLSLNPKNTKAAQREVVQFLQNARGMNYSKKDYSGENQFYALDYLESAKNQIKFKVHKSQEKGLSIATSLAQYMLLNEMPERGRFLDNIDKVSSSDLRKTAGDCFSKGRSVIVLIFPKTKG